MTTKTLPQPPQPAKLLALQRWHSVAAKKIDADTLEWLAQVAAGVLAAADLKDANARRQAVLNATGIAGKGNLGAYLAEVAVWAADQSDGGADGRRAMVAALANLPPVPKGSDGAEALRKRVARGAARVTKRTPPVQT